MNSALSFETGTTFLQAGTPMPGSLVLRYGSFMDGWGVVDNPQSMAGKEMKDAGWHFSFLAGEMKATAFGFDGAKALASGLKRLAEMAKTIRCNSFEISHVTHMLVLGISKVSVSAHARNLRLDAAPVR